MQDRPTAIELLEAAADFVDRELVPAVAGQRQFQARVVANVMRIVAREIQSEDSHVRGEVAALAKLLGHEKPHLHSLGDLHQAAVSLNQELADKIRAGEYDRGEARGPVLSAVRQIVENKLAIANPRYLEGDLRARKKAAG